MKVREIMSHPVVVVKEDTPLEEVAQRMLAQHIGGVPVVNAQGKLSGIVTESDFAGKEKGLPFSTFRAPQVLGQWITQEGVERIYQAARRMTAKEIMSQPVITLTEEQSVNDAVELMLRHNINRLPVVRDGQPVGVVSRHDLLRMMVDRANYAEP